MAGSIPVLLLPEKAIIPLPGIQVDPKKGTPRKY